MQLRNQLIYFHVTYSTLNAQIHVLVLQLAYSEPLL